MNKAQRDLFAGKITEIGNYAITALLLGQFLADTFRLDWTLLGSAIWFASYLTGAVLLGDSDG